MSVPDLQSLHASIEAGDFDVAVKALKKAVAEDPAHIACLALLALALERAERMPEALYQWKRTYARAPDSPAARAGIRRVSRAIALETLREVSAELGAAAEKALREEQPYQSLDDLIHDLESARIVPDPTVEPASQEDLEVDIEDVVSVTLARIYANQRFFREAAEVYDKLASQQPGRRAEFLDLANDMRAQVGR